MTDWSVTVQPVAKEHIIGGQIRTPHLGREKEAREDRYRCLH